MRLLGFRALRLTGFRFLGFRVLRFGVEGLGYLSILGEAKVNLWEAIGAPKSLTAAYSTTKSTIRR